MRFKLLTPIALLATLSFTAPAAAENIEHLQQLMTSGVCQNCELSGAGLVYSDLAGVDLSGSNLAGANLNRANLTGANLSGANLSGAVLYNANLTGANLSGANLTGVNMRESYLTGATLEGAILNNTDMRGSTGIPSDLVTAIDYYRWGMVEAQRGNFRGAIAYYNQSLALDPDLAHSYLARGISRYRLSDVPGAMEDAQKAEELYLEQRNEEGQQASAQFVAGIEAIQEARAEGNSSGGGGFLGFLGSLSSLLVRFLLP